jgi:hypothetical protein
MWRVRSASFFSMSHTLRARFGGGRMVHGGGGGLAAGPAVLLAVREHARVR